MRDGRVFWRWANSGLAPGEETVAPEGSRPEAVLDRFLKIGAGPRAERRIVAFVRRFGPIGFCQHGNLLCHTRRPHGAGAPLAENFFCPPAQSGDGSFSERIEDWLQLARTMRAVRNSVLRLRGAQSPEQSDVAEVLKWLYERPAGLPQSFRDFTEADEDAE